VLTDGIWAATTHKDTVRQMLIKFIGEMIGLVGEHGNRPVSIEFVQFGDDVDATHTLRLLDDDLGWDGIPDVIDTEHCNGDVNKMLLGSFVERYDNFDNEEKDDSSTLSPSTDAQSEAYFGPLSHRDRSPTYQSMPSTPPSMVSRGITQQNWGSPVGNSSRRDTELTASTTQTMQRQPSTNSRKSGRNERNRNSTFY